MKRILKALKKAFWAIWRICDRIVNLPRCEIKWFFQKILRPDHVSDCELWNLGNHLAEIIYYKLKRFKRMERHGYPIGFSEYNPDDPAWPSKKAYDADIKSGKIVGGGPDMWEKYIDEMIFAFGWQLAEGEWKKSERRWVHKNIGLWLQEEKEKFSTKELLQGKDQKINEWIEDWKRAKINYMQVHNYPRELKWEMYKRADNGLKIFGEYFRGLWD